MGGGGVKGVVRRRRRQVLMSAGAAGAGLRTSAVAFSPGSASPMYS